MDNNHGSRRAPIEMTPGQFRDLGHRLVDRIADFMAAMPEGKVTPGESPRQVREALGARLGLPERGSDPAALLDEATDLLFEHSLFIGHPRFMGFITSSPAPIGTLADLLSAAVNPNVGGWVLSPMATEIEAQTVRWIAELLGYPTDCGGLLVSGGNMANFVGFLAARRAKAPWDVRAGGIAGEGGQRLRVYTSSETHTWVQKAADLFGLGTGSIRWIRTDSRQRMDVGALRQAIVEDKARGDLPFLVVGTGGSVSTGAVDPLYEIAEICKEHDLWFHVDGAYGAFAAAVPESLGCPPDLKGLSLADSVAVDPHKWLYAPLEAGCALVRNRDDLHDTFTFHPPYYFMEEYEDEPEINYHEYGMQNSRGFRALKVWLALRQVGREGYVGLMAEDIALTRMMYEAVKQEPDLEPYTCDLSIATFRYVPPGLRDGGAEHEEYLNKLNSELVKKIQSSGELFITNAVIGGKFLLRACIVNFRTSADDVRALPGIVVRLGREVDSMIRNT
ncbi:MAG: aspartate aminotransferase family protein [Chloroflexia bacterium]